MNRLMKTIFGKILKIHKWCISGASIDGYSHTKKNLDKQDWISWYPQKKPTDKFVLALADGHGSEICFRSSIGSKLVTEAAIEVSKPYISRKRRINKLIKNKRIRDGFLTKIKELWLKKISEYHDYTPFTDNELVIYKKHEKRLIHHLETAYGTTLLLLLRFKGTLCYFQIGDGDLLFIKNSKVYSPIQKQQELIANETYSLSNDRFIEHCVFYSEQKAFPSLILIATDGYANSFSTQEDFFKVGSDLLEILKSKGIDFIQKSLPIWLEETSKHGSGDDITVGLVYET
jgi:serine/threonine protein phosphatase PrpC